MSSTRPASLSTRERRAYFGFVVLVPMLGSPIGVDGSPVFQILALEGLGLRSDQIGLAVGLGAISIPFQLMARRIPLSAARRNLRVYVALMAAMCLAMAWLLTGAGLSAAAVVVAVITIAVLAELAVSVLFATSLQPLLATTIDPATRQRLNGQGRAASRLVAIGLVALIGALGTDGRIAVVIAIAVLGAMLFPLANRLRQPEVSTDAACGIGSGAATAVTETGWDRRLVWMIIAVGASVVPVWPFFVTYAADVYWPTANLGVVGVALTVGALAPAALWRPTETGLLRRAHVGGAALLLCALVLVAVGRVTTGGVRGVGTLVIIVAATAAGSVVRMALLEMVHAHATSSSSVSIFTVLDVVGSTTAQISFLIAGFLIKASAARPPFGAQLFDPFQISLIVGAVLLVIALTQVHRTVGPVRPGADPG